MKKRNILKVIILFLIILVMLIIGLFFLEKNNIIENVRSARRSKIEESNSVTVVDVTDLEAGGAVEHEHVYKTMYDENNHWNECMLCGDKKEVRAHTYTTTWALGYESCTVHNSYTKVCSCGFSMTGHKPCVWDGKSYIGHNGFFNNLKGYISGEEFGYTHTRKCMVCNSWIFYSYYLNSYGSGPIYNVTLGKNGNYAEYCYRSDGAKITCNNGGTCVKCGRVFRVGYHVESHFKFDTGKLTCDSCKKNFGDFTYKVDRDDNSPGTYTVTLDISLYEPCNISYLEGFMEYGDERLQINNQEILSASADLKKYTIVTTGKFKEEIKAKTVLDVGLNIGGGACRTDVIEFFPDLVPPVISSVGSNNAMVTEWRKLKSIVISGTENYCDIVKVEILDDNNKTIFKGDAEVKNKNYSISCTPELEAGIEGRNFKVIVTDTCENKTEKEFTIAKIDAIAPEPTSGNNVASNWAKSKKFTFTSTDKGIGNVSIAFNDIKDLALASFDGEKYFRDYEFKGDVYSPKELSVLYKDELGNSSMQKITIDKLDNTAPTITGANVHNDKISVIANDRHERLGEGSGVAKYRFITSSTRLDNPEITGENSTEVLVSNNMIIPDIYRVKYVYIVAEDAVGNVSKVYEIEVPQLELISKVNLNGNNGKEVVELDWSSYDIQNKYFVIYRRQEGEEEWKTIVSLEEKYNSNKYIDNLGNDKNSPSAPNIDIPGNEGNNDLEIITNSKDSGTTYMYYVEAYDMDTQVILSKSTN